MAKFDYLDAADLLIAKISQKVKENKGKALPLPTKVVREKIALAICHMVNTSHVVLFENGKQRTFTSMQKLMREMIVDAATTDDWEEVYGVDGKTLKQLINDYKEKIER